MTKIDLLFYETEYELWALGEFLNRMEMQLPEIDRSQIEAVNRMLSDSGLGDDEAQRDLEYQEVRDLTGNVFPRVIRGTVLVALWAIFQSATDQIGGYIRKKKGCNEYDGAGRGSDLDKIQKYFNSTLNFPLTTNKTDIDRLQQLLRLRNAIVHANARLTAVKGSQKQAAIRELFPLGISCSQSDFLQFSPEFVRETFDIVNGTIRDLIKRVKTEFRKERVPEI